MRAEEEKKVLAQAENKLIINMEVEVKAKVDNLEVIKEKLSQQGASFGKLIRQKDTVNKLKGEENNVEPGSFMLRIREEDEGSVLTFKAFTDRYGVWEEYETAIKDPEEMRKILRRIGFVPVMIITKERTPGKAGKFSFNLDRIKELGDYIEVELVTEDGEKAQEEIKKFLRKLDIEEDQFERRGYPEIIYARRGVVSKKQK